MATCLIADDEQEPRKKWVAWDYQAQYSFGVLPSLPPYHLPPDWTNNGVVLLPQTTTDTAQSLRDWMATFPHVTNIRQRVLSLNQYHKRIYRPGADATRDEVAMRQTAVATSILIDRMDQLFRVIEPDEINLSAFGHEIRNLLLLACTEVEAALRAILDANGCTPRRPTTEDYVKLLPVMHLAEYELRLALYPGFPFISPFAEWQREKPTQSLPWYDAYNQTKHDREKNFKVATLKHAVDAVSGAVILAYAQFGSDPTFKQCFGVFANSKIPEYPVEELYLFLDEPRPELDARGRYRRVSTPTWIHVNCPL